MLKKKALNNSSVRFDVFSFSISRTRLFFRNVGVFFFLKREKENQTRGRIHESLLIVKWWPQFPPKAVVLDPENIVRFFSEVLHLASIFDGRKRKRKR